MGTNDKKRGSIEKPMGRPPKGILSSFATQIRDYIDKYRPSQEGWSAATLAVEIGLEA